MFALATFLFAAATAPASSGACEFEPCSTPPCYIGSLQGGGYVPIPCSVYNPVVAPVLSLIEDVLTIVRDSPIKY
jgi:hypothetical protein